MKSLDEAVEKFKALKQKLKSISEQPSKQTPTFPKSNKENMQNSQNVSHAFVSTDPGISPVEIKKKLPTHSKNKEKQKAKEKQSQKEIQNFKFATVQDENADSKIQTQKKTNHRKNNSWNCSNKYIINEAREAQDHQEFKINSLSSSRMSEKFSKELKEKEKTLGEINELLERKKEVLETLERKIGFSFMQDSKMDATLSKSKRAIRAPNLFQMQAEARKRSKSKTLTIRWK